MRQKSILLTFIESVHLINKYDGPFTLVPAQPEPDIGLLHGLTNVFHTAEHCRHGDEVRIKTVSHQPCDGSFTDTRRSPQNATVRLTGLKRDAQRHPFAQQVLLANDTTQRFWPQAFSERNICCA